MNARERFHAMMSCEPVDRPLLWEFGYWAGAVRRWYREGLPCRAGVPESLPDGRSVLGESAPWDDTLANRPFGQDVHDALGLDEGLRRLPLNSYFCPAFEPEILEERGDWLIHRDIDGVVKRERRDRATLPDYVDYPVHSRDDWEHLKAERLQPTLVGRLPEDWEARRKDYAARTYPLAIYGVPLQGFFGTPRLLLGPENLLMAYYDDPELVHTIIRDLAAFWGALYDQVLTQESVDLVVIWEDMCYKGGPLISPATFRAFMLPGYQHLTGIVRDHGVRHIHVDTDGDCWRLIPLFIEGGVTGIYPWEVMSAMDVVRVRAAFPKLQMLGGIDKTAIAAGKEAIDRELAYRLQIVKQGGYIPHVDHVVPPDVAWDNFRYYRQRLAEMVRG